MTLEIIMLLVIKSIRSTVLKLIIFKEQTFKEENYQREYAAVKPCHGSVGFPTISKSVQNLYHSVEILEPC